MTQSRRIATALLIGISGSLVTMALHPTGPDVMQVAAQGGTNAVARGVHILAIAMQPLLAAGLLGLTLRMPQHRDVAVTAFVAYAIATMAVVIAAACSGLIAPLLIEAAVAADGADRSGFLAQARLVGLINQAMSQVYVGLTSVAVVVWSVAMRGAREFPRTVRWFGIGMGTAGALAMISGRLALDVRGFGLVVVILAGWIFAVGGCLWQAPERAGA